MTFKHPEKGAFFCLMPTGKRRKRKVFHAKN